MQEFQFNSTRIHFLIDCFHKCGKIYRIIMQIGWIIHLFLVVYHNICLMRKRIAIHHSHMSHWNWNREFWVVQVKSGTLFAEAYSKTNISSRHSSYFLLFPATHINSLHSDVFGTMSQLFKTSANKRTGMASTKAWINRN